MSPEPTLAELASSLAESPTADAESDETDSEEVSQEPGAVARAQLSEITSRVLENIRKNKIRAAAAMAATALVTFSTFAYLYQNRLRPVDDLLAHTTIEPEDLQRAVRRAQELIRAGAPTDAIDLLEPIVKGAPPGADRTDAQFLLLQAAYESLPAKVNTEQANRMHSDIDALADLAPTHPRVPEALYWKGQVYEREGNPLAARSVYRDAMETYVGTEALDRILLAYAELEMEAGHPVQAAKHLERLMEDYPGSPLALRARLLRGDAFAAAGDADTARIIYVRSAEDHPGTRTESLAYERLGRLAYTQGEYRDAIRDLETRLGAATTIEGNDTVYLLLAQSYRAIARHQDARDVLNELIRFFPESKVTPLAFVELSRVLSDSGLRKEALRVATETVQRYPADPAVLRNEGERLAEYGNIRAAARAMLAAHAAGANDPELLLSAGKLFREGGLLDEARDAFESIETHFSSAPQALEGRIELAKVLYEQGHVSRAFDRLEDLRMTTQAQPAHLLVLAALGELYQETGLLNRAGDIFGQIAATTSEPEMLAKAAIALLEAGEEEEGFNVIERVNPSRLSDKTAYIFLNAYGDVLLRSDPRAGLEKLEQAYRDYPLQRTVTANRRLLEANLVTGRAARARAIVTELQGRVATEQADPSHLETAALLWGDYLYEARDYRAAADAYALALVPSAPTFGVQTEEEPVSSLSTERQWSMYQWANALFELGDYPQSVALYDRLADSSSRWAKEAERRAVSARIEQRLRGETLPETRESG
ncbi:MAG: tetratricopeptide repeat protein [Candidatus Hydrogenedentes bacterium]|nr:tetratricopeptide repeat protein [Candidatus Hydrogenedentota bacterium]